MKEKIINSLGWLCILALWIGVFVFNYCFIKTNDGFFRDMAMVTLVDAVIMTILYIKSGR